MTPVAILFLNKCVQKNKSLVFGACLLPTWTSFSKRMIAQIHAARPPIKPHWRYAACWHISCHITRVINLQHHSLHTVLLQTVHGIYLEFGMWLFTGPHIQFNNLICIPTSAPLPRIVPGSANTQWSTKTIQNPISITECTWKQGIHIPPFQHLGHSFWCTF